MPSKRAVSDKVAWRCALKIRPEQVNVFEAPEDAVREIYNDEVWDVTRLVLLPDREKLARFIAGGLVSGDSMEQRADALLDWMKEGA